MVKRREDEKFLDVNAAMQGSLAFSDPVNLRINGKFEGNLTTRGNLIIGSNADVKADITGENITVGGKVKGNVRATEVITLNPTAQVIGNVETPRICIEEGAIFNGKCNMKDEKISLEELSDYLSIEQNKIMEWVQGGKLPVEKKSGKFFFDREEVESWIANKT